MRAVKAKYLRRMARRVTQGLPERQLIQNAGTGELRNDPKSTRGVYRRWKKIAKRMGRRPIFTD